MMRCATLPIALFTVLALIAGCQPSDESNDAPSESAAAAAEPGDSVQVVGRLIDARCYASMRDELGDAEAHEHAGTFECSGQFVGEGAPAALVVDNPSGETGEPAETWIFRAVPQAFANHLGVTVQVEGTVLADGVMDPQSVQVRTEDGWRYIY